MQQSRLPCLPVCPGLTCQARTTLQGWAVLSGDDCTINHAHILVYPDTGGCQISCYRDRDQQRYRVQIEPDGSYGQATQDSYHDICEPSIPDRYDRFFGAYYSFDPEPPQT